MTDVVMTELIMLMAAVMMSVITVYEGSDDCDNYVYERIDDDCDNYAYERSDHDCDNDAYKQW